MKTDIDVSFVMSVYNKEYYLPSVLEALLGQTGVKNPEYIFVDDCSKDASVEIIRQMTKGLKNVTIVAKEHNDGISATCNQGIALAKGKWVRMLDSDDIFPLDSTEIMLKLAEDNGADMVYGCFVKTGKEPKELTKETVEGDLKYSCYNHPLHAVLTGCFTRMGQLIKRELIQKAGGADPFVFIQDESIPLRAAWLSTGKIIKLFNNVVLVPKETNNLSKVTVQLDHDRFFANYNMLSTYEKELDKKSIALLNLKAVSANWKYVKKNMPHPYLTADFFAYLWTKVFLPKPDWYRLKRYAKRFVGLSGVLRTAEMKECIKNDFYEPLPFENSVLRKFWFAVRKVVLKLVVSLFFFWAPEYRKRLAKLLSKTSLWENFKIWRRYYFEKPSEPRYYLSLVVLLKDERDYIEEFLEYYLMQGVDHFYIYNNNGTDDTPQLIKPYIDEGLVTWREFPGRNKQLPIYKDAMEHYKDETRWMGLVDIDEFVVPMKHQTLKEALREYEPFSQILMHWVCYGSSGRKERGEGLVLERFPMCQEGVSTATKAILNPRACLLAEVHKHFVLGKTVNEHKETIVWSPKHPSADILRVNHYIVKSEEEYFTRKMKNGRASEDPKKPKENQLDRVSFEKGDRNEVFAEDIVAKYIPEIKKRIENRRRS